MTLSFIKGNRHKRLSSNAQGEALAEPRYLLLVTILCAFLGGFLLGRQESTPTTMSNMLFRMSDLLGRNPEVSIDSLLGQLAKTRLEMEAIFREEYGDFYGSLYDPIQVKHNIFLSSDMSRDRLKRRIMSKILMKLVHPAASIDFVWATGGDSAAAAHGNMFNQSYTSVLETAVKPVFKALGINFVGRNHAMSWYQSAPELALCLEAVYGTDIDVLNWDFAMQDGDGSHAYKIDLWAERATQHPALPILFFVDTRASQRLSMLQEKLEPNGVGFVFMDKLSVDIVRSRVPPMSTPPATKDWICDGGAVEGVVPCDDPVRYFVCEDRDRAQECLDAKYKTPAGCEGGQKPNHPGWKEHQFKGLLLGHFLLEILEEALITLDGMKHPNGQVTAIRSQIILDRLNKFHQLDIKNASMAPIPSTYPGVNEEMMRRLTPSLLFRGNSVCHTALLPAQSRFLGHVTDSPLTDGTYEGGYDMGQSKVLSIPKHNELPMVYETSDRLRCPSAKIDHKDFFYLRNQDGWLYSTIPSKTEVEAYQRTPPEGIIVICLQLCPLDKCSDDYVGFSQVSSQHGQAKIDIKVDGKDVKNVLDLDHRCHVLEGPAGIRWGPGKTEDGRYKLSFRLHTKLKGLEYSVKISSIILM